MTASELSLIKRIAAIPSIRPGTRVGIGDDAAVLVESAATVATQDILVDGVHFRLPTPLGDLGHKALAVNLSDLAAMGAEPVAALVGLILPPRGHIDLDELYRGMERLAERWATTIAGGDITAGTEFAISVCAIGRLAKGDHPLTRDGARPGDLLVVTGPLGASEAGRALLENPDLGEHLEEAVRQELIGRHLRPEPAFEAAAALRRAEAHAVIDCSDGLALDVARLCEASACAAKIDLERVPVARGVADVAAALGRAADTFSATSGEDYHLIAALPPEAAAALMNEVPGAHIVGSCRAGGGVELLRAGQVVEPESAGYVHRG